MWLVLNVSALVLSIVALSVGYANAKAEIGEFIEEIDAWAEDNGVDDSLAAMMRTRR